MLLDEKGLSVLSKNGCATGVRRDQREKRESWRCVRGKDARQQARQGSNKRLSLRGTPRVVTTSRSSWHVCHAINPLKSRISGHAFSGRYDRKNGYIICRFEHDELIRANEAPRSCAKTAPVASAEFGDSSKGFSISVGAIPKKVKYRLQPSSTANLAIHNNLSTTGKGRVQLFNAVRN